MKSADHEMGVKKDLEQKQIVLEKYKIKLQNEIDDLKK